MQTVVMGEATSVLFLMYSVCALDFLGVEDQKVVVIQVTLNLNKEKKGACILLPQFTLLSTAVLEALASLNVTSTEHVRV